MKNNYNKLTACKAALSLITGILLIEKLSLFMAGLCWVLASIIYININQDKNSKKIIIVFILVGMLLTIRTEFIYNNSFPETVWENNPVNVKGVIKEDLKSLTDHKIYLKPLYISNKKVNKALIQLDCRYLSWTPREGTLVEGDFILNRGYVAKNPGGFSYQDYLKKNNIMGIGYLQGNLKQVGKSKKSLKYYLVNFKKKLIKLIDHCVNSPYNEIYKALLLGERSQINSEWHNIFKLAGASHLLAISGLHVGFIILILIKFFNNFSLPLLIRDLFITFLIIGYILLTGGRASIVRAGFLSILFLWAPQLNRTANIYNILAITAIILLFINPYFIFNIGFQLTYIILLVILNWQNIISKWTCKSLGVAISAQLGAIPIISYHFNIVTPIGILTNIWAISLIGIVILLSFPSLFLGLFLPKIFILTTKLTNILLKIIKRGMEITANLPMAQIELPTPSLTIIFTLYIILFIAPYIFKKRILPINRRKNLKYRKMIIYVIIILIIYMIFQPYNLNPDLKISFFAVGQGDSVLFELPNGQEVLIDGGGTSGINSNKANDIIIPYLRKEGIREIDLAIITHFDSDHALGILGLLEKNKIKTLLIPKTFDNNKLTQQIITLAQKNKIKIIKINRGHSFNIEDINFKVLHPFTKSRYINQNRNNNSIVLKVKYKNFKILLTGDLEIEGERYLIKAGDNLKSNILKIGHHGSISSSSLAFLESVKPDEAIISVGKNNYGHPDKKVINRLNKLNIRKWITEDQGAIIIETDGNSYKIKSYL